MSDDDNENNSNNNTEMTANIYWVLIMNQTLTSSLTTSRGRYWSRPYYRDGTQEALRREATHSRPSTLQN